MADTLTIADYEQRLQDHVDATKRYRLFLETPDNGMTVEALRTVRQLLDAKNALIEAERRRQRAASGPSRTTGTRTRLMKSPRHPDLN